MMILPGRVGIIHVCLALPFLSLPQLAAEECKLPPPEARFVESYLGTTGEMRYVKTREDLPTYGEALTVDFFYMESVLSAANGKLIEGVMTLLGQYHSGIRGEVHFASGLRKTFVLEFWGNGKSTVAPYCVDENGPKWQHNTVVVFTDGWDRSKWFGHKTSGVHIATLTDASSVNALFDFVLDDWALNPKRKTYMQWQWWPSMYPGWRQKHTNFDLICDSFSESVIWKLSDLTQLRSPIPILRRNYGIVLSSDPGTVISKIDPRVISFYQLVIEKDQRAFLDTDVDFKKSSVVLYDQVNDQYLFYPNVHVHIKYDDMPMPPAFYTTCSQDTGAYCLWFCNFERHAQCASHKCTCPSGTCAFEDDLLNYCKGPEEPATYLIAGNGTRQFRTANITVAGPAMVADRLSPEPAKMVLCGIAALGLIASLSCRCARRRRSQMKQPELFG